MLTAYSVVKATRPMATSFVAGANAKEVKRLQVHKQTRLCRFFAIGACTRGTACSFAHGQDKLREQPDFSKTRLCANFIEIGSCAEGSECKFAHSKDELRPGSAAKIGRPKAARSKPANELKGNEERALEVKKIMLQKSLHEQAALDLIMKSCPKDSPKGSIASCSASFSRQSTCEGVDSLSVPFSRGTSLQSETEMSPISSLKGITSVAQSVSSYLRELPKVEHVQVLIKNTFIEVAEDCEDGSLKRTRSLPMF